LLWLYLNKLDEAIRELLPKPTIFKSAFPISAAPEIFDAQKVDMNEGFKTFDLLMLRELATTGYLCCSNAWVMPTPLEAAVFLVVVLVFMVFQIGVISIPDK
jgi:hypothetical protein